MRTPHVCTAPATHRRIVSLNPKALGATTSSRNSVLSFASPRGTGQGEGEPNLPIKNPCGRLQRLISHKCSWSAHESPVYRHCFSRQRTAIKWAPKLQDLGSQLLEIIGFEISFRLSRAKPFSSPRGRGYSAGAARTEGELVPCSTEPNIPIKNPCGRLQRLINHKCSWSAHETPVYRPLSEIIGFEISFRLGRAKPFSSPGGEDQGEGETLAPTFVQNLQFHTKLHSAIYTLNHYSLATYH
jgi:hypothetical protein